MSSMQGGMGMRGPTGGGMQNQSGNIIPKGYKQGQLQQFTPEQMQLFQSQFSQVGPNSQLAKLAGGDQSQFDQLEAPAMKQFQGLQGQIASRFSGAGMGARNSSGFQNTMNTAAQDFAGQLQSQRMGLQRQAINDLMGFSNQILGQQPYEQSLIKQDKPWWQEGLTALGGGLGQAVSTAGGMYGMSKFLK